MQITDYHSQYDAFELVRRAPSDSIEKLAGAVAGAQVDVNPHQVDAALFAFRSPLSKGALLADEVGLGKTIEAGLVIAQKWAERKRRILVITPSNLRKQWFGELREKFFLPCTILETKGFNSARKAGRANPFEDEETVVICSYQFARAKADEVHLVRWDMVVMDEAHRLRNVYKPSNVIANTLKIALKDRPKLLLTATPLQNSLLELYGLVSFIDEHAFGDLKSFREQFANLSQPQTFETLKARLKPLCHRTLRRQVTSHVAYTARHAIVESFTPDENEDALYALVSEYLQRPNLEALPAGQRSLMTLVLRKLLASSSFAIAGALNTMSNRLRRTLANDTPAESLEEEFDRDYEALDETADEWPADAPGEGFSRAQRRAIEDECEELQGLAALASSIQENTKGQALLQALETAFAKAVELGAARKAIIFTESRRTQEYLQRLLSDSAYSQGIVLFNGSNTDAGSKEIYAKWQAQHAGTDRVTGSRSADMRSALVDYFRDEGQIMIATEAGAEGINLQFCSLVVNYDLPWNPQRVEQRIGRCHRYGQKHDVVVVNFLNTKNEADQRVYELLLEKFQLFEGVFGASDEVLGAIGSGVDFEKRIAEIYQKCRKTEEIKGAFDQLQRDLSFEINEAMTRTSKQLLENFDDEVREKLRTRKEKTSAVLNQFEKRLLRLSEHELNGHAHFSPDSDGFDLHASPFPQQNGAIPLGRYELPRRSEEAHIYRLGHPLAQGLLQQAQDRALPLAEICFNLSEYEGQISVLKPLIGQSGWLRVSRLSVESLGQSQDDLLCCALTDAGTTLPAEDCCRFFSLPGRVSENSIEQHQVPDALEPLTKRRQNAILRAIGERNAEFFMLESQKIDEWADDKKVGLEREIKEIDRSIKEARRAASAAPSLQEKLEAQKQIRALESERNQRRRALFDAQDEIDSQREVLISQTEALLQQKVELQTLFTLRWKLI